MTPHEESAIVGYWRMTESIPLVAELIGFTNEVIELLKHPILPSADDVKQLQEKLVTKVLIDKNIIQNYGK